MPYKVFVAGEEALAADVNNHLMSQTVSRHASSSARASAISAPALGQMSQLNSDVIDLQFYNGSAWQSFPWYFSSVTNYTTVTTLGPSASVTIPLAAKTFPRACSYFVDLLLYVTVSSGSGAGSLNSYVVTNGNGTSPALNPGAVVSNSPFLAATLPVKGFWRNHPANANMAPNVYVATGANAAGLVLKVDQVAGFYHVFPPGSEF
jgi:hypothetical protein